MARVFNVFTGTFDEIGDPVTGLQVDGSGNMYLGGSAGQASALLTLNSTTKGFLPIRLTQAQRTAIVSPAQGLKVYQTDGGTAEGDWIYRGGSWNQFVTYDSTGSIAINSGGTLYLPGSLTSIKQTGGNSNGIGFDGTNQVTVSGNIVINGHINSQSANIYVIGSVNRYQGINISHYVSVGNAAISSSSGINSFYNATPNINQSGTAGYTVYYASIYEQTVGSGARNLIDVGTNSAVNASGTHTSKFRVDSTGAVTLNTISPITGNNYITFGGNGIIVPNVFTTTVATTNQPLNIGPGNGFNLSLLSDGITRLSVRTSTGNVIIQPAGGTITDVPVAALQIVSTTQGFLGPNMTQAQRTAITAVQGLRVYQTDGGTTEGEYAYRGGTWQQYAMIDGNNAITFGTYSIRGSSNDMYASGHIVANFGLWIRSTSSRTRGIDNSVGANSNNLGIFCGGNALANEAVTIDTSGNVGIGYTNPNTGYKLSINGNGYFGGDAILSPSGSIYHYNTADQTTNYETVRSYWSGNSYYITTLKGGTGTNRDIVINGTTFQSGGFTGFVAMNRLTLTTIGATASGLNQLSVVGTPVTISNYLSGASSGTTIVADVTPGINHTGTAGYTGLRVSAYEQTVGSGTRNLLDLGTNTAERGAGTHTSRFRVDVSGNAYVSGNVYATALVNSSGTFTNFTASGSTAAIGGISTIQFNISGTQVGLIGTTGSALFQLNSTTQGFLGPVMTSAQRTAISSPAQGLKVYQTDGGTAEGDWVYRAGAWWQTLVVNGSGATPGALTVSGNLTATTYTLTQPTAISSTATTLVNLNNGDIFQINLAANISVLTVYNARVGTFILKFTQDATGSRTVAWPAAWKWSGATAPTITATAGKTDVVSVVYDGTNWYASILQNF